MSIVLLRGALLAAVSGCLVSATDVWAQTTPSGAAVTPSPDPRDFQGFWQGPPLDHNVTAGFTGPSSDGAAPTAAPPPVALGRTAVNSLPLRPEVAAKAQHDIQMTLKGTAVMTWHVACRPGPPQTQLSDDIGGYEVIQAPGRVLFLFDTDNTYWEVYLDRDHPQHVRPSYLGHSVGHWEGNTLVVDTIGYNGRGSVIMAAAASKQLHTVTRFWKDDSGKRLEYQTYIDDPVNLTKPASLPVAYAQWTPDHKIYEEHCTQSQRQESNADMIYEDFTREEAFPYLYKK
jgi:hypothetical protein